MNFIKSLIGYYFNFLSILFPRLAGKQSFYFFCIPFKAKLKAKQQAFLDTAEKKLLEVDNKKIQSYSWGKGDKIILFVHGWQSNSYRWKNYIEKIDLSNFKVVAFDAPGHGNSEGLFSNVPLFEKSIKAVCDFYGTPHSIVSHSIGAFSSMYYLHNQKLSVDKFVSLATPFTAVQFVDFFQSELNVSDKLVKQMKAYFKIYTNHDVEYYSLNNFGPSLSAKTLLIHDEEDESTPVGNTESLHNLIKDSILYITKGYGHRLKSSKVINRVHEFVTL